MTNVIRESNGALPARTSRMKTLKRVLRFAQNDKRNSGKQWVRGAPPMSRMKTLKRVLRFAQNDKLYF